MCPSHAGLLGAHARPIMLMQAPPSVPKNLASGTDAEAQPAKASQRMPAEMKEVHEHDPLVEEFMRMQEPQRQLNDAAATQSDAPQRQLNKQSQIEQLVSEIVALKQAGAAKDVKLEEQTRQINHLVSDKFALKHAGAAKDIKLEKQSEQIKQLTSERATEKIQMFAKEEHAKTLELDKAKWERVARSAAGFSIGLCQPSGNCVLSDCLLPSDTVKTLFDRACSAFDISKHALHIVVGEDAFSWLDSDPGRLRMTLDSLHLTNGASVTCVYNAKHRSFEVGQKVEYWSRTHMQWMRAEVSQVRSTLDEKGLPLLYDLDVKRGASVLHMRAVPSHGGA